MSHLEHFDEEQEIPGQNGPRRCWSRFTAKHAEVTVELLTNYSSHTGATVNKLLHIITLCGSVSPRTKGLCCHPF